MGVFDDFLKPQAAPWVSPFQSPLGPFGTPFAASAVATPFGPPSGINHFLSPTATPLSPSIADQLFAAQIATFNAPPRPQQGNDPTPQQIFDQQGFAATVNRQKLAMPDAIPPGWVPQGPIGTVGINPDSLIGTPPAGPIGPVGPKGKKKTDDKKKLKQNAAILPPWLQTLIQSPPTPAPYVPLPNAPPKYKPLTDSKIEALRRQAENAQDVAIHEALVEYAAVRKRVADSPDMTVKSKRQATAWIDNQIRTIERQQKAERASGIATATQLRASGQAAAEMQSGLGEAIGRNYTEAARVMNTLGQGIGAGVQGMGEQSLQNIGIAGQPTSPLAGGLMPGAVPAASGQAVATIGGALPAQNLALQAAGAGPGYVSGGVTNILGQTAAQILAGGNQMALGAQIAGAQRARDLNAKIDEARASFPQLYSQLLGTNQAHQDAINKQMLDMAQGGLETVFKASQIPIDRLDKRAAAGVAERQYENSYRLDMWQGINALNSADRAHQDAVNALKYDQWNDQVARGFDYLRLVASIKASQQKAAGGPKLPTVAQARTRYNKFTDAMAGLSGHFQFTNGAAIPAVYGEPEEVQGQSIRKMINTPVTIDEAIRTLSLKFPDQTGYSGPGAKPAEKAQRHAFLAAIKEQYGVQDWTDKQAETGRGLIPGTDFIGKLPLQPIYTKDLHVKNEWKEHEDDHDPENFNDKFWDEWFEATGGKQYPGGRPAEGKKGGGGGGIFGFSGIDALNALGKLPGIGYSGIDLGRDIGDRNNPPVVKTSSAPYKTYSAQPLTTGKWAAGNPKAIQIQGETTPQAVSAIKLAERYLGTPYVWGGETPGGFDCSGLLQYVWGKQGVSIPRVTYDQWRAGSAVDPRVLRPGDAVFFNMGSRGPEHVGMYIGGGQFIESPRSGLSIRISNLAGRSDFVGARRYDASFTGGYA